MPWSCCSRFDTSRRGHTVSRCAKVTLHPDNFPKPGSKMMLPARYREGLNTMFQSRSRNALAAAQGIGDNGATRDTRVMKQPVSTRCRAHRSRTCHGHTCHKHASRRCRQPRINMDRRRPCHAQQIFGTMAPTSSDPGHPNESNKPPLHPKTHTASKRLHPRPTGTSAQKHALYRASSDPATARRLSAVATREPNICPTASTKRWPVHMRTRVNHAC